MTKQDAQNQIKVWITNHMPYSPFKTAETGEFYYEPDTEKINVDALNDLMSLIEHLDEFEDSKKEKERIIEILADKNSLAKFAAFDFESYKMSIYNHLIETESEGEPNENGSFMQRAEEEAHDHQHEVIANAESDFRELFELLEIVLED